MPQPLEVQQGEGIRTGSRWEPLLPTVVGPAHGHGRVRAIGKAHDQVGINTPADADDLTALAMEGMMRVGNGHRFPERLG